jgi:hypothetical protein
MQTETTCFPRRNPDPDPDPDPGSGDPEGDTGGSAPTTPPGN